MHSHILNIPETEESLITGNLKFNLELSHRLDILHLICIWMITSVLQYSIPLKRGQSEGLHRCWRSNGFSSVFSASQAWMAMEWATCQRPVTKHIGHGCTNNELSIQVECWKHRTGSCLLHSSLCQSLGCDCDTGTMHCIRSTGPQPPDIDTVVVLQCRKAFWVHDCGVTIVEWALRLGQALLFPTLQKRKDGPRLGYVGTCCWDVIQLLWRKIWRCQHFPQLRRAFVLRCEPEPPKLDSRFLFSPSIASWLWSSAKAQFQSQMHWDLRIS